LAAAAAAANELVFKRTRCYIIKGEIVEQRVKWLQPLQRINAHHHHHLLLLLLLGVPGISFKGIN